MMSTSGGWRRMARHWTRVGLVLWCRAWAPAAAASPGQLASTPAPAAPAAALRFDAHLRALPTALRVARRAGTRGEVGPKQSPAPGQPGAMEAAAENPKLKDPNYCGSCYGAQTREGQCCNTCAEVRGSAGWLQRCWGGKCVRLQLRSGRPCGHGGGAPASMQPSTACCARPCAAPHSLLSSPPCPGARRLPQQGVGPAGRGEGGAVPPRGVRWGLTGGLAGLVWRWICRRRAGVGAAPAAPLRPPAAVIATGLPMILQFCVPASPGPAATRRRLMRRRGRGATCGGSCTSTRCDGAGGAGGLGWAGMWASRGGRCMCVYKATVLLVFGARELAAASRQLPARRQTPHPSPRPPLPPGRRQLPRRARAQLPAGQHAHPRPVRCARRARRRTG